MLRDEVTWLRGQVDTLTAALRLQATPPPAPSPLTTPVPPAISVGPLPPEELLKQAGIFADPVTGLAMVMYDGKMIPWTEWNRGQRAVDQAMAGKPIETEG